MSEVVTNKTTTAKVKSSPTTNIIEKIVSEPKAVKRAEIDKLVQTVTVDQLREMFLRIYDLNNTSSLGTASVGFLGKLNRRQNKKRNKLYLKTIRNNTKFTKIYVEGDSWYNHPLLFDIIDGVIKTGKKKATKYAIYSSAMGADWWINMLNEGKYLSDISREMPEFVLLSGGGNDFVGGRKISYLVDQNSTCFNGNNQQGGIIESDPFLKQMIIRSNLSENDRGRLTAGLRFLTKELCSVMWTFELMYKYLLKNLQPKFPNMKIITQGYDCPIPTTQKGPIYLPKKYLLNKALDNGSWLYDALATQNIHDSKDQQNVIFSLIYIFNDMLVNLAKSNQFGKNLSHIDCRGVAGHDIKNWFDEMHVKPKIYKKIANAFVNCIDDNATRDVYKP